MDRRFFLTALAAGAMAMSAAEEARAFPDKPLTIIVPYAPGATDQLARALGAELEKVLGKPVLVETRPGAGGTVGANYVAKTARPDGHTLLFSVTAVQTLAPHQNALPYTFQDLKPVARISVGPNVLAAHAGAPFRNLQELVAYARANPERVSFASPGTGSASHLQGEAFARAVGAKLNHIPFQGVTPSVAATVGGTVDLVIGFAQAIWPQVEGKRLIPMAQFATTRAKVLPDLTTFGEAGVNLALATNTGVWVASGTPPSAVATLEQALQRAAQAPEFLAYTRRTLVEVDYAGSAVFTKEIEEENVFYKNLLGQLGMGR